MAHLTLTALLLAGAASAQNLISSAFISSGTAATAIGTGTAAAPRITLAPDETTISVFAGGEWTAGLTGSIISIDACATTYAFYCTDTDYCTATDFTATLTQGPSSWGGVISTEYGRTNLVGTESCAISASTRAVCVATATVVVGTSTVIVGTTSATRATYFPLPIPRSVSIPTGTCSLAQSVQYNPAATTGARGYTSIDLDGTAAGSAPSSTGTASSNTGGTSPGASTSSTAVLLVTPSPTSGPAPMVTAFVKGAVVPAALAAVAAMV